MQEFSSVNKSWNLYFQVLHSSYISFLKIFDLNGVKKCSGLGNERPREKKDFCESFQILNKIKIQLLKKVKKYSFYSTENFNIHWLPLFSTAKECILKTTFIEVPKDRSMAIEQLQ